MTRVLAGVALGILLPFTAGAQAPLPPNELGRVMILEYHKVDYPEERWTRTPENFRRDLESLYRRCLLYTSPSPRDRQKSRMPSSA